MSHTRTLSYEFVKAERTLCFHVRVLLLNVLFPLFAIVLTQSLCSEFNVSIYWNLYSVSFIIVFYLISIVCFIIRAVYCSFVVIHKLCFSSHRILRENEKHCVKRLHDVHNTTL